MTTKDNGGPAFPYEYKFGDGTAKRAEGMTMRDYFAGQALTMLSAYATDWSDRELVNRSYAMADAMLEARK